MTAAFTDGADAGGGRQNSPAPEPATTGQEPPGETRERTPGPARGGLHPRGRRKVGAPAKTTTQPRNTRIRTHLAAYSFLHAHTRRSATDYRGMRGVSIKMCRIVVLPRGAVGEVAAVAKVVGIRVTRSPSA